MVEPVSKFLNFVSRRLLHNFLMLARLSRAEMHRLRLTEAQSNARAS